MPTRSILAVLLLPSLADAAALVELYAEATVSGQYVTLGEVARIEAINAEEMRRLQSAILGPAPEAGRTVVFDGERIRARLRAVGVNVSRLEFNGQSRVLVQREVTVETATELGPSVRPVQDWKVKRAGDVLEEAFRVFLDRHAPGLGEVSTDFRFPESFAETIAAGRSRGFEFRPDEPVEKPEQWMGERNLHVRCLDRDRKVVVVPVRVTVAPWPTVLVARRTIEAGHVLQPEDLEYRQVESAEDGFTDPREVLAREAKRTVRAGRMLRPDDVRQVPLVRRNDVITLVSRSGTVAVSSYAKSKDDGGRGESIRVVTLDGRNTVVAKVTGFHEAEVATAAPAIRGPVGVRFEPATKPDGRPEPPSNTTIRPSTASRSTPPTRPRPRVAANPPWSIRSAANDVPPRMETRR